MKKIRKVVVSVIVTAMLLAACGSSVGRRVDSGEIVVPEISSEDLLVSSLEFLLQDEEDTAEKIEETEENAEDDTDASEESNTNTESEEDRKDNAAEKPAAQERVPKEKEAVIYYGNAGSYDLKQEIIQVEEESAEELLAALARHNIVSLDTKLLSFEEEESDEGKVLYLELSKALDEYLKTMSKEAECIILASVVNTFLENYDADSVYLVVNGKTLATKNAEYEAAFVKCTPEELLERLKASDSEDIQEEG
ncbi:MAG: GerMN domain-containing protein [Lachnospiraceae bacterium]|nr:GerMN domain-containing protein [Lachnospiraceae bacterium]